MCGLAGFIDYARRQGREPLERLAREMAATLAHRGPDDEGAWADAEAGVALGHRRLAIIDTSSAGAQPMVSSCRRWVIVYNGEVYNFPELRAELEAAGRPFRGHSDTEVILEGCAQWGVRALIERLIGMFAFALWDRRERALVLVRDRLGIKPLYWGIFGDLVLFGSQLSALRVHRGWRPAIDRAALTAYLRRNYVPCPYSIYRGVSKLEPGTLLTFREGRAPAPERYWSLAEVARAGRAEPRQMAAQEAAAELGALLGDAVRRRLVADVPLGALLSGGIDSALVTALMRAESSAAVKTFSIGFDQAAYDEAARARAVAAHLGTEHRELYVEPGHVQRIIPGLARWFDEPFGDLSLVPTYLVAELARQEVTVALSGDGGDELFAGYDRYRWAEALWRRMRRVPRGLRAAAAAALGPLPPAAWDPVLALSPRARDAGLDGDRLKKALPLLAAPDADALYRRLVGFWLEPRDLVRGGAEPERAPWDPGAGAGAGAGALPTGLPDFLDRMQLLDATTYLPDHILTKVDRATMAVSLETRVPLLDHRVVEFTWRLPAELRATGGEGKALLRRVLFEHAPRELFTGAKKGFALPVDAWLRGPLRPWAEELLSESRLEGDGLLRPGPIRAKWREHLSGQRNWQYLLWNVLMLQTWKGAAGL